MGTSYGSSLTPALSPRRGRIFDCLLESWARICNRVRELAIATRIAEFPSNPGMLFLLLGEKVRLKADLFTCFTILESVLVPLHSPGNKTMQSRTDPDTEKTLTRISQIFANFQSHIQFA